MAGSHQNLGGPVVLRHHLLRHVLGLVRLLDARQPEITDLQHAVAVHKQIARLDVSVQDAGRVQILEAAQYLVEEHLDVILRQVLRGHNDLVEIRLQQFCYHITGGDWKEEDMNLVNHQIVIMSKLIIGCVKVFILQPLHNNNAMAHQTNSEISIS